ncbi:hypothetical protein KFL_001390070 [Klebsormidium nitens]|uniref:Uncharacterized protein n=1 Tax=Klebsormidium nitens TaxID=105231 RepID=A0A1Y1I173_KLENI|nr:hypothetical protein KFL_001390070 [Klebsormidium nitens]|eukprot:GAQ83189.1 hypothetical protein KFL_001390070 [Klebsormidium nitens]
MEAFKELYVEKCRDFLCEPISLLTEALQRAIESRKPLTTLKLNGNRKELFSKRLEYMQVFALTEALHDETQIVSLDLSYNNIDDAGAATIARLLKFNSSLQSLNLEHNNITGEGVKQLAASLQAAEGGGLALRSLNLRGNPLEDAGGMALADMLKSVIYIANVLQQSNRALQKLNLDNPRLFSLQEETASHIARMLANTSSLQEVKLGKHAMRDAGLETLLTYGMIRNKSIDSLDLRCNQISETSAANLARLLGESPNLRTLNLACNRIGDAGAAGLAEGLLLTPSLTSLDLSHCSIKDSGLLSIAEALKLNRTVIHLKLWGNEFGQAAAAAFDALFKDKQRPILKIDFMLYSVDGQYQVAQKQAPS